MHAGYVSQAEHMFRWHGAGCERSIRHSGMLAWEDRASTIEFTATGRKTDWRRSLSATMCASYSLKRLAYCKTTCLHTGIFSSALLPAARFLGFVLCLPVSTIPALPSCRHSHARCLPYYSARLFSSCALCLPATTKTILLPHAFLFSDLRGWKEPWLRSAGRTGGG